MHVVHVLPIRRPRRPPDSRDVGLVRGQVASTGSTVSLISPVRHGVVDVDLVRVVGVIVVEEGLTHPLPVVSDRCQTSHPP